MSANYEKAISCYDSAYVIANSIKDWYRMQLLAGNLGNTYKLREKFPVAIEKFREAIRICESIGGFRHLATWYSALAQTFYYTENFNEALIIYQKSEELAVKENNFERQVFIKMDRGNIYLVLNFVELVENEFQKAYELVDIQNLEHLRDHVSTRIAELLIAKKEYAKARGIYRNRILSMPENADLKWKAYYTGLIGNTYLLEERFADARQEYLKALEYARAVDSPNDIATFQCDLADLKVQTDELEGVIEDYDTILHYALTANNNNLQVRALKGLGNVYQKSGDLEQAIKSYKQGVEAIEEKRESLKASQMRIGYFSLKITVYQKLGECYLRKYEISGDPSYLDSLFHYSEMARGRSLADIRNVSKIKAIPGDNPQYQKYQQLCQQLRKLQRKLRLDALEGISGEENETLRARLDIIRYSLVAQQLRLGESTTEPKTNDNLPSIMSLSDLTEGLQNMNMGLLVYNTNIEKPFVLASNGEQTKVVYLPASKTQIDSAIHDLIVPFHQLSKSNLETTPFRAALAYQLYLWLIKPVENVLPLPERLIVVPDLNIVNLPFEVLLTREPEKPEFTPAHTPVYSADFLQHRHTIVYSPNTRVLEGAGKTGIYPRPYPCLFSRLFTASPHNRL
jgi:tetratricopeptide (TPR) repeat protein